MMLTCTLSVVAQSSSSAVAQSFTLHRSQNGCRKRNRYSGRLKVGGTAAVQQSATLRYVNRLRKPFMPRESAGLLMYRMQNGRLEFLLVHPGGPFWQKKDAGAWTIPKGELEPGEEPLTAARREFAEELGFNPEGQFIPLAPIQQKGGKRVQVWAFEGDCDPASIKSNTFEMEWPPRSGRRQSFPEIDRAAFFELGDAKLRINPAQVTCLDELKQKLAT